MTNVLVKHGSYCCCYYYCYCHCSLIFFYFVFRSISQHYTSEVVTEVMSQPVQQVVGGQVMQGQMVQVQGQVVSGTQVVNSAGNKYI